jgi:peroxiredoxin
MVAAILLCALLSQPFSISAKEEPSAMPKVGDLAPEFTLKYFDGSWPPKEVKLSDYRGKKQVVLAFYIFAFTGG